MTLEDFFTLTEMKNGFASLARVEELVSIMQQQKDCVISNVSDTARQWSTVANIFAATESKDCLDHFVKLNGLCYINQWLQGALNCSDYGAEFATENLLISLLGLLERLTVYTEDLVASGIQLTVEQFVGFKSFDINEKAKALSERWKHATKNGVSRQDMDKDGKCEDDNLKLPNGADTFGENSAHPVLQNSTCREELEESAAGCMKVSQPEKNNVQIATEHLMAAADRNLKDMKVLPSAGFPNPCQNLIGTEDSSLCPAAEIVSSVKFSSSAPVDVSDNHGDASKLKDDSVENTKMDVDAEGDSTSNSGKTESCKIPLSSSLSVSSHAHKPGRSISCNFDVKNFKSYTLDTVEALPSSASIDCVVPKYLRNMDSEAKFKDLLVNKSKLKINTDPETSLNKREEVGNSRDVKVAGIDSKQNFSSADTVASHGFSKPAEKKTADNIDESSELGLEYGEIDALEVARQVAIEVEREVVDYREPFCSSSPDENTGQDMSPQCSDDHKDQNGRGLLPHEDHDDASPKDDNKLTTAETVTDPSKCEQDVEMAEPTSHQSSDKTDQNRCTFDLNEDVSVEESDSAPSNTVNITAPIVVSASKGAPVLPVSPPRFEGDIGWKGSAATSAFRPASPRRTPDLEKTSSGNKRKANLIEFDLNVAESEDDDHIDPLSVKPTPIFFGIHSREDSVEVSSRRVDKVKWDLNSLGEEDVSPFPSSHWSHPTQNGDQNMSPASSSTRGFDLNDNPGFFCAMGSHNPSRFSLKASGMHASSKPDNVITIMGAKITEGKNYLDGASLSIMGNRPGVDANVMTSRPMMAYGQIPHPAYRYNDPVIGPPMPYPPSFYAPGSIPYMVDSQGATIVPQILNTPVLNAPSSTIPSFPMNVSNTNPGFNLAEISQSGLDLSSGFLSLDTGNRESGNFKNFFTQPTTWR